MSDVIDPEGFRANVAIVLSNDRGELFWAGRAGRSGWQFPQGGILEDESPLEAMYRELHEEVGLTADDVDVIGEVPFWLRYRLPKRYQRRRSEPLCIGQKQRWYLLRMRNGGANVCLTRSESPEFDRWCWVDYWYPLREVVYFKRRVYERALSHLSDVLFPADPPPRRRVGRRSEVYRDAVSAS